MKTIAKPKDCEGWNILLRELREVTPSYIDAYTWYTCALDLFIKGLYTLYKRIWGTVNLKIKVNACILTHPINKYKLWGEPSKNTLFYLYNKFLLIPQVTNSFDFTPNLFSWSPIVVLFLFFFSTLHFVSYTFCERTLYSRRPLKGTGVSIYLSFLHPIFVLFCKRQFFSWWKFLSLQPWIVR